MLLPQFDTFSIVTLGDPFFASPISSPTLQLPHQSARAKGKEKKNIYPNAYVQEKENGEESQRKKESRLFGENFVATFCCRLCSIAQQQQQQQHEGQTGVLKDFFNNRRKENLTFVAYVIGNATFFWQVREFFGGSFGEGKSHFNDILL